MIATEFHKRARAADEALLLLLRGELQGNRIDAVPLTGGCCRSVIKNVPKMRVAPCTSHFDAGHSMRMIWNQIDAVICLGSIKGRPATAGMKFRCRFKQLRSTCRTGVRPRFEMLVELVCVGPFRALTAEYVILLRREESSPFFGRAGDFLRHCFLPGFLSNVDAVLACQIG